MNKAIYMPKGKAGEYAKYAVNFYVGCSNDCDYCYCKRGLLGHAMGKPTPTLKKCFKDYRHAFNVFQKEMNANLYELQKHGLFFTFTSDPFLYETIGLTLEAVDYAIHKCVPCQMLTKRADFIGHLPIWWSDPMYINKLAFGFTLTGMDEMEPNANTNAERIECMSKLHRLGHKTFASIEPVINLNESGRMITEALGHCDLFKIGLLSGKKNYTRQEVMNFVHNINQIIRDHNRYNGVDVKVYWKDSVPEFLGMSRDEFPEVTMYAHCVGADYNIFRPLD